MGISGKIYNLLENYLADRHKRVILIGQTSSWIPVLAAVSSCPLLFLVYISDLPGELKSDAKLLSNDTSLIATVKDKNESANIINDDLQLISK